MKIIASALGVVGLLWFPVPDVPQSIPQNGRTILASARVRF